MIGASQKLFGKSWHNLVWTFWKKGLKITKFISPFITQKPYIWSWSRIYKTNPLLFLKSNDWVQW